MSRRTKKQAVEIDTEEEDMFNGDWLLDFNIRKPFYFRPKHAEFYNIIGGKDTNMALVDGPAGTAKTYIAVYAALEMLREQEDIEKIVYIRSIVESADRSLGSLPGEIDDKFSPYMMPLIEKVTEICGPGTCSMLKSKGLIDAIPVNFVRGLTFNKTCVIVDEAQNLTKGELITIMTRFGRKSKYIICGDCNQSDIRQSGFKEVFDKFDGEESEDQGIFTTKFGLAEIVRSKILRFICQKLGA
jgi:phosphate starvation-inducible PhoH-like protein